MAVRTFSCIAACSCCLTRTNSSSRVFISRLWYTKSRSTCVAVITPLISPGSSIIGRPGTDLFDLLAQPRDLHPIGSRHLLQLLMHTLQSVHSTHHDESRDKRASLSAAARISRCCSSLKSISSYLCRSFAALANFSLSVARTYTSDSVTTAIRAIQHAARCGVTSATAARNRERFLNSRRKCSVSLACKCNGGTDEHCAHG